MIGNRGKTINEAPMGVPLPEPSSPGDVWLRFSNLRGVRWRINLGILPSSSSVSIDDIRRVAADARRSYATLRRRLLIDPYVPKDGNRSSDLSIDNPLSQNPESTWGRFFHNAELEKAVDQDLSRLYPENDHYFKTHSCQAMLRRVLLVWCLRYPDYGYRQGMHELLAPLVYVLHADLEYLSHVREFYEEYFIDEFEGVDCKVVTNCTLKKVKSWDVGGNADDIKQNRWSKITTSKDLDPDTSDVLLLSDSYGAEGELGIVLSEKFMEHDAYCMFDGLMNGAQGVVAMNKFFLTCSAIGSSTGVPPVIEASSAIYYLLSIVDSSLHDHLVELGVEPQYFALRWLRVQFGREFSLSDLLVIWDEIFLSNNDSCIVNNHYKYSIMCSPRGAFIVAMAVSMLLHVRSSLLATENATSCLKRLLNFPNNFSVEKIIGKAKFCQALALEANMLDLPQEDMSKNSSSAVTRTGSQSPKSPIQIMQNSYWEEKWRVLHKEKIPQNSDLSNLKQTKGLLETLGSLVTESFPSPAKIANRNKEAPPSVKHSLFDDSSQNVDFVGDVSKCISSDLLSPLDEDARNCFPEEPGYESSMRASELMGEDCSSTYNFSIYLMNTGPNGEANDPEIESEKSSITSNSFIRENEDENDHVDEKYNYIYNSVSKNREAYTNVVKSEPVLDVEVKDATKIKERKPDWLWRIGKGRFSDQNFKKGTISETQGTSNIENVVQEKSGSSGSDYSSLDDGARIEVGDKKMMSTLKNLGQSMLENVQVIESVLQQKQWEASDLSAANGQAAVLAALKDLRKISIILSEM